MIKAKTIALAIPRENRRVALAVLAAIGATIKECAKAQEPECQIQTEPSYAAKLRRGIVIASRYYEQGGVTTAGAAARGGEPGPTKQEEQSTESIASEARKEPEDV